MDKDARIKFLEDYIEHLGDMHNACVYHALNRVCDNCECKRKKAKTNDKQ